MAKKAAGEGVYRVIDIIGTSKRSWEDATKNAVETATRSLRDLRIEVIQQHPERRLCRPRPRVQLRAAGRANPARLADERLDPGLQRVDGGHRFACSRRAARFWSLYIRHHVQPVASTNAAPAHPNK